MGGNDWDDTCSGAGGIQTLALFNALSSKGNQTISVNVCVKVSDHHRMCSPLSFSCFDSLPDITGPLQTPEVVLKEHGRLRSKGHVFPSVSGRHPPGTCLVGDGWLEPMMH